MKKLLLTFFLINQFIALQSMSTHLLYAKIAPYCTLEHAAYGGTWLSAATLFYINNAHLLPKSMQKSFFFIEPKRHSVKQKSTAEKTIEILGLSCIALFVGVYIKKRYFSQTA